MSVVDNLFFVRRVYFFVLIFFCMKGIFWILKMCGS